MSLLHEYPQDPKFYSEYRCDPAVQGRMEKCDKCCAPFRTFRQRPLEFICGRCTKPIVKSHEVTY